MLNRRKFCLSAMLGATSLTFLGRKGGSLFARDSAEASDATGSSSTASHTSSVPLSWLDGTPPKIPAGVSWGIPWPRGIVPKDSKITVRAANGQPAPTQSWPLAYWPDGTLKWSGMAVAADANLVAPLTAEVGASVEPTAPVTVREEEDQVIEIASGDYVWRVPKQGPNILDSISIQGRAVARECRLVLQREDRADFATKGILRQENFQGRITSAKVEQSGPVRAVVRIDGHHALENSDRTWLPFCLRLYFTAGMGAVRIVHSFVFDGDEKTDFIKGLGLSVSVPFREEMQNRHVRFAGDKEGVWAEPVLISPGYRAVLVKDAQKMNDDQMAGKRVPNLDALDPKTQQAFQSVAVWDGFKLNQAGPDSFSIDKRTGPASSWLHVLNGNRARGMAFLGDVTGGVALGSKYFWQKYPSMLEIEGATKPVGNLCLWFWSPDAPAMDIRRYDTIGHDGRITYEDFQEGYGTPHGVANTQDLTLWALPEIPGNETFAAMAQTVNEPPLLVCASSYYHETGTLGIWSLPDRSTETGAMMEDKLDQAWQFYQGEIDQRRWYGFWDFGDVMRTYSVTRHAWLYDIGGHAWNNTELMPNAWLWMSFLRTGSAPIFRMAEAMTRHTSEVDVYHLGPFFGLGSRHNVNHWGCGAKESRISEAWLKRFYYYLTTDERTGDLMREPLTVDETIGQIQPLRKELVRADVPYIIRLGPDWLALASNWMTEWERTGDTRYRDYVLTGMNDIGAMPEAFRTRAAYRYDIKTKHLADMGEPNQKAGEFLDLFGGDQIIVELISLIDCPSFAQAWYGLADEWGRNPKFQGYTKTRITAFAALHAHDEKLADAARELLRNLVTGTEAHGYFSQPTTKIEGPTVIEPVQDEGRMDTPGVSQWALNLMTTTELLRQMGKV